jgi:hypothetical protein
MSIELRGKDFRLLVVLSLAGLCFAVLLTVGPAMGTITGDAPPVSGEWIINNPTTVSDETLYIDGNITVNDMLTITSSNIVLVTWSTGENGIRIAPRGHLTATDTTFKSDMSFIKYEFAVEGKMDLLRTRVEDLNRGLRVMTGDTVTIKDSKIVNFTMRALYLIDADETTVEGCHITTNEYQGRVATHWDTSAIRYTYAYAHGGGGGAVLVEGGSPTLDDIMLSINGTVRFYNYINKIGDYVYNRVYLTFVLVVIDSDQAVMVTDINISDSRINPYIYNEVYNNYTGSDSEYINIYSYLGRANVAFKNIKDATIDDIPEGDYSFGYPRSYIKIYIRQFYSYYSYTYMTTGSPLLLMVDEKVSTVGPHDYTITLKDRSFANQSIFSSMFGPDNDESIIPTFNLDIIIENVDVYGGRFLFSFRNQPQSPGMKNLNVVMRLSNCTFTNVSDVVVEYGSSSGGTQQTPKRIVMNETFIVENCTFTNCDAGYDSLISISTGVRLDSGERGAGSNNDLIEEWHIVRNSTFKNNRGTLMWFSSDYTKTQGHRRVIVEDNDIIDNWCDDRDVLFYASNNDILRMNRNRFINNYYQDGISLYDTSKSAVQGMASDFQINHNVFLNNTHTYNPYEYYYGFFKIQWGGKLEIAYNNISVSESRHFFKFNEYTYYVDKATIDFHHNEITNLNATLMYFYGYSSYHQDLVCRMYNNKLWDNDGHFMEYYYYQYYAQYDYDATFYFANNTIIRSSGRVFQNYGDITIVNNTFKDCAGPVVVCEYLNIHSPTISGNMIVNCEDVYVFSAKSRGFLKITIEVSDLYVDCTGTAFRFMNADIKMENVTVTNNANIAIIAEEANVDAIDCLIPEGSGQVIGTGSIYVWFNIEMWILWADADGVAHGGKVAEALVVFHGVTGTYYLSDYSDSTGHLKASQILQWSMAGPYCNIWSPYTITVAKNGISTKNVVQMDRSYKGENALILHLQDDHNPFGQIVSPFKDALVATEVMNIRGFATDVGSGIGSVNVSINGQTPTDVSLDERGDFLHEMGDIPEGPVTLTLNVMDVAGNGFQTTVDIVADRTPPRLVILEPTEGSATNQTFVLIRGEFEPGASVVINEIDIPGTTGTLSTLFELSEGTNVLIIEATDPAGNKETVVLNVTLDRLLPILTLASPRDMLVTQSTNLSLVGTVEELADITVSVYSDTTDLIDEVITPDDEGSFSHGVDLAEGRNVIVVRARDAGQNWAIITRIVYVDTTPPECAITSPADGDITNSETVRVMGWAEVEGVLLYLDGKQIHNTGTVDRMVRLHEGPNDIELRAVDAIGNEYTHSIMVTLDTHPPVIVMTSPLEDSVMISSPMLRLVGRVMGDANTLTVDGTNVVLGADGSFDTTVTISAQGLSEVEIIATDLAGNFEIKTLQVDLRTEKPMLLVTYFPADIPIKNEEGNLYIYGNTLTLVSEVVVTHTTDLGTDTDTYPVSEDGSFNIVRSLEEGTNEVSLTIVDAYGNSNETQVYSVDYIKVAPDRPGEDVTPIEPQEIGIIILVIAMTLFATAVVVSRNFRAQRS